MAVSIDRADIGRAWPCGLKAYRRTPSFNAATVPPGLLHAHSTRRGIWGKLHVEAGRVGFTDEATGIETELGPGVHPVILPQTPHHMAPKGAVRFFIEFYAIPRQEQP